MKSKSGLAAAIVCLTALALSACAGAPEPIGQAPGMQVASLSDLPRPLASDRLNETEPYLLGALDKLDIDVYGVPDLHRAVTIDANGTFSFPLVGVVQASGQQPSQVAEALTAKLRTYVRDPQVTVNVTERVSQTVTVDGQVTRPGQFPLVGRQTLMRAIAIAGGTGEYARLDDVVIFRTVQGQRYVGLYNLGAIRRGNYPDPEIFANDIIIVGDSKERRMFQDILQTLPILTAPIVVLVQSL